MMHNNEAIAELLNKVSSELSSTLSGNEVVMAAMRRYADLCVSEATKKESSPINVDELSGPQPGLIGGLYRSECGSIFAGEIFVCSVDDSFDIETRTSVAKRLCECANASKGMDEPINEVKELRENGSADQKSLPHMVYLEGGGAPTYTHENYNGALTEAVRLTEKTGRKSRVLRAITEVSIPKPNVVITTLEPKQEDGLPF